MKVLTIGFLGLVLFLIFFLEDDFDVDLLPAVELLGVLLCVGVVPLGRPPWWDAGVDNP